MLLYTEQWICILFYSVTLCFAFHNMYFYLYKDKRWSTFLLTVFYVFAVLTLCTRLGMYFTFFAADVIIRQTEQQGYYTRA